MKLKLTRTTYLDWRYRCLMAFFISAAAMLASTITWTEAIAQPFSQAGPSIKLRQSEAGQELRQEILVLGSGFDGDIGIAVKDVQSGFAAEFDGHTYFPQQSVSKLWVALTALDAAERKKINLLAPVVLRASDLTLFHQPIASQIRANGQYKATLASLITRALQQSDNTCNDFVLRAIGGPQSVQDFFASKQIEGVRFGPGERLMQSKVAGLTWRPEYSVGGAFFAARSKVPLTSRRAAFDEYVANPVDGAKPIAMVEALSRLWKGELLSAAGTAQVLQIMSHTRTGPMRLKGGLAPGWQLAHKTGTGQQIGAMQTGYNDVGIVTSAAGRSYAVAVMIRRTSVPIPVRMAVMQNVVRAVVRYDSSLGFAEPSILLPSETGPGSSVPLGNVLKGAVQLPASARRGR